MRDDERTGRNDPAYKRMCFVVAEGTRLGYREDEEIFWVDDRRQANSTLTLGDCRALVERWTEEIEVQEEFERRIDALGEWASETDLDDLRRQVIADLDRRLAHRNLTHGLNEPQA